MAVVHCKAGKGRTGDMICSYLGFSGLCQSSEKSFKYYARVRTKNNTVLLLQVKKDILNILKIFLKQIFVDLI